MQIVLFYIAASYNNISLYIALLNSYFRVPKGKAINKFLYSIVLRGGERLFYFHYGNTQSVSILFIACPQYIYIIMNLMTIKNI